jgi:cytochrome c556
MRVATLLLLIVAALAFCWPSAADEPAQSAKQVSLMRQKLAHAEKILEGISVADFQLVARHAGELNELTMPQKSGQPDTTAYKTHLQVFRFATNELERNAAEKNLDAASLAYVQMTLSCVNCHKFLREQAR